MVALAVALAVTRLLASAREDPGLAARCARGFPAECRELGRARLLGDGIERDDRLAASYLTQACEIGDPAACSDLAVLYALGRGFAQSDERASALARRACEQGAAIACSNQGALLAEGVGEAPRKGVSAADVGAAVMRLFRAACDAGVPEGCANLGTAHEEGRLAVHEPRTAARAFRRACDAGLALACHRLALLVQRRPEVAPDLSTAALHARACAAGIAPACDASAAKLPAPGAQTPAARLVDDPGAFALGIPGSGGFSPGELAPRGGAAGARKNVLADLRRPSEAIRAAVPEELRVRLGVDAPAAAVTGGDAAVELLVALRRPLLGQCYETARAHAAVRTEVFAILFLDGDGHPAHLRVASRPTDEALEECVRGLVERWEFPASEQGTSGPFLVLHAFEAAPGAPAEYAAPGGLRPAPRDPACVQKALRIPAELRGSRGGVTVKLAVDAAGKPGLVHPLTPVPDEIVSAVAAAVRSCAWSAGGDADGRPVALWTTLTVKLDAR
jgi:TPR repeat protein